MIDTQTDATEHITTTAFTGSNKVAHVPFEITHRIKQDSLSVEGRQSAYVVYIWLRLYDLDREEMT